MNKEIDLVDDLFLKDAAKKGKRAKEIELAHLLHERHEHERLKSMQDEIKAAAEE